MQIILDENDIIAVVKKTVSQYGVISVGKEFAGKRITVYITEDKGYAGT